MKECILKIIPQIFQDYLKTIDKKIFNFIGNYTLNHIYLITDFLENENNFLFKALILNQLYYIILTEICILIFYPVKHKKIKGKLIFVKEIRNIYFSEINNNINLKIKFNDNNIFIIKFNQKDDCEFFNHIIQERKKMIYSKMKEFKNVNFEDTIESILIFINYKEKDLEDTNGDDTLNELIILYQKAIEIFSNENDKRYNIYLEKLKKLLDTHKKNI